MADRRSGRWLVDSGCNRHLTNSVEGLTNVRLFSTADAPFVTVASGTRVPAVAVGNKALTVPSSTGTVTIQLLDVLLVPNVVVPIISVSRLVTQMDGNATGHSYKDGPNGACISLQCGVTIELLKHERLVWIQPIAPPSPACAFSPAALRRG